MTSCVLPMIPIEYAAKYRVAISRPGNGGDKGLPSTIRPKIYNLQILDTTSSSLMFSALVNITNPTPYSASIPYADIHILVNGSLLGHATVRDLDVGPGENNGLFVKAVWDPLTLGGTEGKAVGSEFLSQYISGYNTTLTLQTHNGSIPTLPGLGRALSRFEVKMPTPSLRSEPAPGDGDDDDPGKEPGKKSPHFIEDATMHLITSTATFTLLSPLRTSTIYITYINATAYYKEDDVGHIDYDLPFAVPPVDENGNGITTPRLPVDWSLGSVGYDAVRRALGGTLKLHAEAVVSIMLGKWEETVWFKGGSIGAKVRL